MKDYINDIYIGKISTLLGMLHEESFYIFVLKNVDYTITMISAYGTKDKAEDSETK